MCNSMGNREHVLLSSISSADSLPYGCTADQYHMMKVLRVCDRFGGNLPPDTASSEGKGFGVDPATAAAHDRARKQAVAIHDVLVSTLENESEPKPGLFSKLGFFGSSCSAMSTPSRRPSGDQSSGKVVEHPNSLDWLQKVFDLELKLKSVGIELERSIETALHRKKAESAVRDVKAAQDAKAESVARDDAVREALNGRPQQFMAMLPPAPLGYTEEQVCRAVYCRVSSTIQRHFRGYRCRVELMKCIARNRAHDFTSRAMKGLNVVKRSAACVRLRQRRLRKLEDEAANAQGLLNGLHRIALDRLIRQLSEDVEYHRLAARVIQVHWRGGRLRSIYGDEKTVQVFAAFALRIQAAWRGYKDRCRVAFLLARFCCWRAIKRAWSHVPGKMKMKTFVRMRNLRITELRSQASTASWFFEKQELERRLARRQGEKKHRTRAAKILQAMVRGWLARRKIIGKDSESLTHGCRQSRKFSEARCDEGGAAAI